MHHERDDVDAVLAAVSAERDAGRVEIRERVAELGGQEIQGVPFRWIEIDDPPAVHFPDGARERSGVAVAIGTLFVVGLLAVVFAIVSAAVTDWLFAGILGATAVVCVTAALVLDRRNPVDARAVTPGVDGLTLTPDLLVIVDPAGTRVVARDDVIAFGARRTSPASTSETRFAEYVDARSGGVVKRIDLQPRVDTEQRTVCEAWRAGSWPVPLPR